MAMDSLKFVLDCGTGLNCKLQERNGALGLGKMGLSVFCNSCGHPST